MSCLVKRHQKVQHWVGLKKAMASSGKWKVARKKLLSKIKLASALSLTSAMKNYSNNNSDRDSGSGGGLGDTDSGCGGHNGNDDPRFF